MMTIFCKRPLLEVIALGSKALAVVRPRGQTLLGHLSGGFLPHMHAQAGDAGGRKDPLTKVSCPFVPAEFQVPVTEPDINNRLESLCLSMTEHALSGEHSLLLGLFQHVHAASAEPPATPKSWDRLWL